MPPREEKPVVKVAIARLLGQLRRPGDVPEDQGGPVLYRWPSRSRSGTTYTTMCHRGVMICDCTPGGLACIHIRTLKEAAKDPMTSNLPAIRETPAGDLVPEGYEPLQIVPRATQLPSEPEFQMMMAIANTVVKGGGMVPQGMTADGALAVMLAGYELSMPPMTSLRRLFIVNGRTEMETQALMGLVKANDPTARFVFHRYDQEGADVALWRNGELVIRCSYTKEDRDISKQGFKKQGTWQNPSSPGGKRWFKATLGPDGQPIWEPDPDSYWQRFPRDAYAYNAVKRCVRLGAPELSNQIRPMRVADVSKLPQLVSAEARAGGDEDDAPRNQLAEGLISGAVKPEDLAEGGTPEDLQRATAAPAASAPPAEPPAPEPALVNAEQKAGLSEAWKRFEADYTKEEVLEVRGQLAERFPHIFLEKSNAFSKAHAEDFEPLSDVLWKAIRARCDHEPYWDPDTTLMACSKCGEPLGEQPPAPDDAEEESE